MRLRKKRSSRTFKHNSLLRNPIRVSKIPFTALLLLSLALSGCGKGKSVEEKKTAMTATIISDKLAAIVATGDPISSEELDKWYAKPPVGENAAEIYAQAFAALTTDDPQSASYVSKNQRALALLLQATERKACRYPIDLSKGFETLTPHLTKFKNSATLLSEAANIEATANRTPAAVKYILAGIQMSRSVENEPVLISRLVEIASLAIMVRGLEQILTRKTPTGDQLLEVQTALHDAGGAVSFRRAFAGERVSMISLFRISPEDWVKLNPTFSELAKFGESIYTNLTALDIAAYKKTPIYHDDFNFALDYITALMERADKPFPEALGSGDEPKFENAAGQELILSSVFLPALNKALERAARSAAQLRTAQTALAIERFRLQHSNALPGSLTELTPTFLAAVPADPFEVNHCDSKNCPCEDM
jgi:hypothetical protein